MNAPDPAAVTVGQLKPCPFCGGEGHLYSVTLPMEADCTDIYVRCLDCDAMGPQVLFDQDTHSADDIAGLETEAIAAWNTRTQTNEAMREALEKCRDTFAQYAEMHRQKLGSHRSSNSPEYQAIIRKVERNRDMADLCIAALALSGDTK